MPPSTGCSGPRPSWPARRSATPTAGCRTPPAGTAAAVPGRRSRSRCSVTPAPPATASAASRRPRAPGWARAWPSGWTDASTCARSPWSAHSPATSRRRSTAALQLDPDVAVILIGANDVTHSVLPAASVRHLSEAVRRLRDADVAVVVGTCPDLGTISPIPMPLRQVARVWSRRLAAAQTIAVVEAGGRTVSLGSILGPEFAAAPALLFGPDHFHPSAAGYEALARLLVPSVLSALGEGEVEEETPRVGRGEAVMPIGYAAVQASQNPGTEIDGTEVGGALRGVGGRWVTLMRRRLLPTGERSPDDATRGHETPRPMTRPRRPRSALSGISCAGSRAAAASRCRSTRSSRSGRTPHATTRAPAGRPRCRARPGRSRGSGTARRGPGR